MVPDAITSRMLHTLPVPRHLLRQALYAYQHITAKAAMKPTVLSSSSSNRTELKLASLPRSPNSSDSAQIHPLRMRRMAKAAIRLDRYAQSCRPVRPSSPLYLRRTSKRVGHSTTVRNRIASEQYSKGRIQADER